MRAASAWTYIRPAVTVLGRLCWRPLARGSAPRPRHRRRRRPPPPPPPAPGSGGRRRVRRSRRRCRRRSSRRTAASRSRPPPRREPVKNAIYAANQITNKPYRYGGGHRSFQDSRLRLLRLRQLRAARRQPPQAARCTRRAFMRWGAAGPRPVDHGLHEPRPRLRDDRRPAVRHLRARASAARAGARAHARAGAYTARHPEGF